MLTFEAGESLNNRHFIIVEIDAENSGTEPILASIAVKNRNGRFDDIPLRRESLFDDKKASAFTVRSRYFHYRAAGADAEKWLEKNLRESNGVSILVLQGYFKSYRRSGSSDRVILVFDLQEMQRQKYVPTIVLGWKQGSVIAGE
jgi:hypothetical protein